MAPLLHDELAGTAQRRPDATALIAGDRHHTFAEVDRDAGALAHTLQARGVRRGDRVAVMADNSAEVVVALYAALKAGGVFVVVNPTTKADKLAFILDDCQVSALVVHRRLARVARPALAGAGSVVTAVWIGGPAGNPDAARDVAWDDALATAAGKLPADPGVIDADLGALVYTSGSTGRPKGVMLTHGNLVHNAWSISTYLGLRDDDVIACLLPLAFSYGLFQVLTAARVGAAVLLETSFAYPHDVLERLARHRVTVFPGVPTMWAKLLPAAPFDGVDLSAVRMLTNAAAALPPTHISRLGEAFPTARFFSMYGLTECTRVSYLDPDRLADKVTSVGQAMPNTEAYVVGPDGRRLPPGETGELVVRGASVMRGYWGRPDATAACLRSGEIPGEVVLHTGDQFRTDDEGFLYFVGRTDDVFKCRGEKVSATEIEHVLYELDAVAEAAVIGVPDELDGTAVKAVVVAGPGAELAEDAVRAHCRARLQNHMVPRFVEVRAALPKTDSGKIRKAALA